MWPPEDHPYGWLSADPEAGTVLCDGRPLPARTVEWYHPDSDHPFGWWATLPLETGLIVTLDSTWKVGDNFPWNAPRCNSEWHTVGGEIYPVRRDGGEGGERRFFVHPDCEGIECPVHVCPGAHSSPLIRLGDPEDLREFLGIWSRIPVSGTDRVGAPR